MGTTYMTGAELAEQLDKTIAEVDDAAAQV